MPQLPPPKRAKTAVVFAWTRGRPDFALPGDQNKLIEEIAAVNPNTDCRAQRQPTRGAAVAEQSQSRAADVVAGRRRRMGNGQLLLGKTSPAGRLPFTWGKRLEDYAATDPAHPERSAKRSATESRPSAKASDVGYRWFDKQKIAPLFPFGYGLSYTTFAYSDLKTAPASRWRPRRQLPAEEHRRRRQR